MKSWSLGRKSGKREKKKDSNNNSSTSKRPQSMIFSSPSSSSNAEVSSSSVRPSPAIAISTGSPSATTSSSPSSDFPASTSASKYLNSAQLKDIAQREKTLSTSSSSSSSNKAVNSSRPPISNQHNNNPLSPSVRTRTISLPSLLKSPVSASTSISTTLLSPAEAIVRGSNSETFTNERQVQTTGRSVSPTLYKDSDSIRSSESLTMAPSPSSKKSPLRTAITSTDNGTRLENLTYDIPHRREREFVASPKTSFKAPKEEPKKKKTVVIQEVAAAANDGKDIPRHHLPPPISMVDLHHPTTAVESLRQIKGVEGYGTAEKKKSDQQVEEEQIKEESSMEEIKQQGGTIETVEADTKIQNDTEVQVEEEEPTRYSYAVRKKKRSVGKGGQIQLVKRKPRPIEARYDLTLIAHGARSLSFQKQSKGAAARLFIAMPVPAILGCDRAASWTVERISRLTACVINIFGS